MPVCPKCGSAKVELLSSTELKSQKEEPAQKTLIHVYQCECGVGFTGMEKRPNPANSR